MNKATPLPDIASTTERSFFDPLRISPVTPPPVTVVYKGWWNYKTTFRQASDLLREDREQQARRSKVIP